MEELEQRAKQGSDAASSAAPSSVPYEQRQLAIVGNLGWNEEPGVLAERAQAVLADAGIDRATWAGMAPLTPASGLGSAAEVMFNTPQALQTARLVVKSLRREFLPGKAVWLDAKRDRAEAAPVRIVHRLHEALMDTARTARPAQGASAPTVTKDVAGRAVRVNGLRVAYISQLRVKWTPAASDFFGPEEKDAAAAYAEAS